MDFKSFEQFGEIFGVSIEDSPKKAKNSSHQLATSEAALSAQGLVKCLSEQALEAGNVVPQTSVENHSQRMYFWLV